MTPARLDQHLTYGPVLALLKRGTLTVASKVPFEFQARPWIESPCASREILGAEVEVMSQSRMTWSPDADASTLDAVGWNSTWPTFL